MAKLRVYENLVLRALKEYPDTRKDDYLLLLKICEYIDFNTNLAFDYAIKNHSELGLPNWKTIERCRRKIQEKYPELKDIKTAIIRHNEEIDYKEYSYN